MNRKSFAYSEQVPPFPGPLNAASGSVGQEVQITMDAKVKSLNVSMAAGIMLYSRTWFNVPQARK